MIPETLIIKGLYSYQQETIFDFTPLTQAGLFGIFGAVGSGKSTILEAITFALYGETERLNNRDGRGYNMMNLKSNDLLIDFVFTSGSQDQKYRFTVSTKRNKKRYNETDSFKKDAYEWINGNWQPTPKTAEDIIGLSYENFKRTIIIPQGKFQEFLQLKDTERVQMLKEIFNLEKYELGPKVGSLSKANDIKISHVEGQMLALPIFSEEDLKNQEHGIQEQEKLLAAQMTHFAMLEQQQKVFELTKLLFEEAAKKEAHYHELQTQEVDFLAKEEQLATYENCEKIFKNLFEQKDKIQKSIVEKQAKIAGHEKENKEVEQAIEAAQATLNNLEKRYSERDTLLQKAAELEKILAIKKLQLNINQLSTRLTNGKKKISDSERQLADGQQGALLLQNQIAAKEKQLPDISFIIKITDWFAKQEQLILESQKLSKEMTIAENKLPLMLQQIGGVLQSFPEGLKFDNIPEDLATVEAKANELFDSYKNRIGILNDELAHVQLAQKLGEFSANLKPGDPCPLCGALEHPNPLSEVNPGENIQRLRQDIKEWESATSSAQKKLVECASLYAAYTAQLAQVNQIKKQTEKAAKDLISYNNTFAFEGFTILDESLAKNQLNTHQQLSNELTSLRTQLQETQKSNDETAKSLSTYKTAIEQFLVDQAKAMSEANLLKTQITALDFEATVNKEESVLIKSVVAFQTEWKELTNVHEDTSKQMQQHLTRQGGIRGKLDEMRNQLLQENIEGDRLNGQIATQMLEHNYSSEHDIKQILATSINVTSVRSAVNDYRNNYIQQAYN